MTNRLIQLLAHACVVLALVLLTLLVFDYLNPTMDFINNPLAKVLLAIVCLLAITVAILLLTALRVRHH